MDGPTRRAVLGTSGAVLAGLAGCTSLSGGANGDGGTDATPSDITLDTYDVGGSTGETVPVQKDGAVTLLDFFATWCAPCKSMMPRLGQIRADNPDVHMLSITWEQETSAIEDFWRTHDGTWNVASDPDLTTGEEYGVGGTLPTTLVLDPEGNEAWRHTGLAKTDEMAAQVEAAKE